MPGRKNADRLRPKKSSPAVLPNDSVIPPSPPAFMLDDDHIPVASSDDERADGAGNRLAPAHLIENESVPNRQSHEVSLSGSSTEEQLFARYSEQAHRVTPLLTSEPSVMDNLARAVRSFYPTSSSSSPSINTPKKRPASFGGFLGSAARRRGSSLITSSLSPLLTPLNVGAQRAHDLPETTLEEDDRDADSALVLDTDSIIFCNWYIWDDARNRRKHFLLLGYEQGFQIWDTSSLDFIQEVAHVKDDAPLDAPVFAGGITTVDLEDGDHHLVATLLVGLKGSPDTQLIVYSLTSATVIHSISVPGALHLAVNSQALVISSIKPSALHVFSVTDYTNILVISTVSSRPVFSLSGRLLAFTCPPPQQKERHLYSNPGVISRSPHSTPMGSAMKVGSSLFAGVKTLSGMAMAAATSRISDSDASTSSFPEGRSDQWFSRSAPATAGSMSRANASLQPSNRRRGESQTMSSLHPSSTGIPHEGTWVDVVDLACISNKNTVKEVHRFRVSTNKPISRLHWSDCGSFLYASPSDGQTIHIYSIHPNPTKPSHLPSNSRAENIIRPEDQGAPWHIYDLHRGHSSANILTISINHDNRWAVAGTHRGTLHVFGINPYGGQPDVQSHITGKVHNVDDIPPLSTSLVPLIRIRPASTSNQVEGEDPTPMAVRFLSRMESLLLPSSLAAKPKAAPPIKYSSSPPLEGLQSTTSTPAEGFQDILVFHPTSGVLELFRMTLDAHESQPSTPLQGAGSKGGHGKRTSIDSSASSPGPRVSALSKMMDRGYKHGGVLHAKDSSIATWKIRRKGDWPEILPTVNVSRAKNNWSDASIGNWLAQAEITTCSQSPRVLPPSIYLSHQFSFHTFLPDYDALLRSDRFVVPTTPVTVRKEVQISTYAGEANDPFMQADGHSRSISQVGSEGQRNIFDEPMAKAISDEIDYSHSPPPTYPMLPNGASLSSRPFMDAVPIRRSAQLAMGITEGVGEGLGVLRREIAKVRSPRLLPRTDEQLHVQGLEDEELLDHNQDHDREDAESRMTSEPSLRTPPEGQGDDGREPLVESWDDDWADEDQKAIDEEERYDEIYPAGVMDEEEPQQDVTRAHLTPPATGKKRSGKKRR